MAFSPTVLVIDSKPTYLEEIKAECPSCQVITVGTIKRALSFFQDRPPNLVITRRLTPQFLKILDPNQHLIWLKSQDQSWRQIESGIPRVVHFPIDPGFRLAIRSVFNQISQLTQSHDKPYSFDLLMTIFPGAVCLNKGTDWWVNPTWEAWGLPVPEQGTTLSNWKTSLDPCFEQNLNQSLDPDQPFLLTQKNAQQRVYTAYYWPSLGDPQTSATALVLVDSTDVQQDAQIKDQFIATVSHELRTPVAAIKEGVATILEGLFGPVSDDQKQMLTQVQKESEALQELLSDLLDLSASKQGQATMDFSYVDLVQILTDMLAQFSRLAKQKNIELRSNLPETLWMIVDSNKIKRVVSNLLDNAVKHTPELGQVTLSATVESEVAKISVSDTGQGVPKANQCHLFDAFFRSSQDSSGLGLGLAICKQFIELHGGTIEYLDHAQKGAEFWVALPIRQSPSVLVIQSAQNPKMTSILSQIQTLGWQVEIVFSANEALLKGQQGIDLIVLDMALPDHAAYELIGRLKESATTRSIPIVMIANPTISANLVMPAQDFNLHQIAQPFEPDHLLKTFYRLIH